MAAGSVAPETLNVACWLAKLVVQVTRICSDVKDAVGVTVIFLVPWPETIVNVDGILQI